MRTLDNDIKELCDKHRTGLNYLSFSPLGVEHLNDLPALRIYAGDLVKNTEKTYQIVLHLFAPYPDGCSTFEEAKEASKDQADIYFKMLEELINTGLVMHKGYKRTTGIAERTFPGQSFTEHKVIALQVSTTLEIPYKYECCDEGTYFDFADYLVPQNPWGK